MIISGTANNYFLWNIPGGHEKWVRKIYNLSDSDYDVWKKSHFSPSFLKDPSKPVSDQVAVQTGLVPRELVIMTLLADKMVIILLLLYGAQTET